MQVKNARPYALTIAATDQQVAPGEVAEVDDELGRALLKQPANWVEATPDKPAPKRAVKE